MKKSFFLISFFCFLLNGYNQKNIQNKNSLSDLNKSTEINFTKSIKAADLDIKRLIAVKEKDSIYFTLTYSSKNDRFLSFFNPPFGTILMYFDKKGIKKSDTITSFRIANFDLHAIDKISMRFSKPEKSEKDRNFIFINTTDPFIKEYLGLSKKGADFRLFSKIFPLPFSFFVLLVLCIIIPFFLYLGNKFSYLFSPIERKIANKWLIFNIKTLIFSILIIITILIANGSFRYKIPLINFILLLLIPILSSNLVYIIEIIFYKRKKQYWLKEYLSLVVFICGLYFFYKITNALSREIISHFIISTEHIVLCGFLVGFIRLINNYILYQKTISIKEKEFEISRLNELKTRSDLNALQSKINPHFLYNALNSIAELCWKDPEKTELMAINLSKLFRYTINKENSDFNIIKNEIEIVSLYLSIEKVRFGDNLNYLFDIAEETQNILIPKFIIQPLIENAVKHGISKIQVNGQIKLSIKKDKNNLEIKVFDNGPDFPLNLISGYGLKSIFDKLDILYPKRYSIEFYNGIEKNITIILKDDI